jgi:hypothetical protein
MLVTDDPQRLLRDPELSSEARNEASRRRRQQHLQQAITIAPYLFLLASHLNGNTANKN